MDFKTGDRVIFNKKNKLNKISLKNKELSGKNNFVSENYNKILTINDTMESFGINYLKFIFDNNNSVLLDYSRFLKYNKFDKLLFNDNDIEF